MFQTEYFLNTLDFTSFRRESTFSLLFALLVLSLLSAGVTGLEGTCLAPLAGLTGLTGATGGGGTASSLREKVSQRLSVLRAAGLMHNVCTPEKVALEIE